MIKIACIVLLLVPIVCWAQPGEEMGLPLEGKLGTPYTRMLTPVPSITAWPLTGYAPLTVQFFGSSTSEPISAWLWNFGGLSTSTARRTQYTFTNPGTYTVSLRATNFVGQGIFTATDLITVLPAVETPVAAFAGSPLSGTAPLTVAFADSSTGGATSWTWVFGDGPASSTLQNPSHTYQNPGLYNVTLVAQNSAGSDIEFKKEYVSVSAAGQAPIANFIGAPTSGDTTLAVQFTDMSVNTPTSWYWDFGDGYRDTLQNPEHEYTVVGTYDVSLTATNDYGSNTVTKPAYITANAVVETDTTRVTDGLLALYLFNEGDGNLVVDRSGYGTPLNLTIGSESNVSWLDGGGLRFNSSTWARSGSAAKINDAIASSGAFTVEMWVAPASLTGSGTAPLRMVNIGGNLTLGHGRNLGSNADYLAVRMRGATDREFNPLFGSSGIKHIVYTHADDDTTSLYNNASLVGNSTSTATTEAWVDTDVLTLANNLAGDRPWLGSMYLVAIYDKALSSAEIEQNYLAGLPNGGSLDMPPVSSFVASFTPGTAPRTVQFTDTSTNGPTTWVWNFGDGGSASGTGNVQHTYMSNGTFNVTLTVSNSSGSTSSTQQVYIGEQNAPYITSVSGTFSDGGQVTIGGTGFGVKPVAAPLAWTTFEGGVDSTLVPAHNGFVPSVIGGNLYYGPRYSSAASIGDGSMGMFVTCLPGNPTRSALEVASDTGYQRAQYVDFWYRLEIDGSQRPEQFKPIFGTGNTYATFDFQTIADCTERNFVLYPYRGTGANDGAGAWNFDIGEGPLDFISAAKHVQLLIINESYHLAGDGEVHAWINGSKVFTRLNDKPGHFGDYVKYLMIGNYETALCPQTGGVTARDATAYYDNIYVDGTPARIEIGNAPSYEACTHREIQIPSEWSETSITATVNTGALGIGTKYLFVVDPNGNPSTGKQIDVVKQYAALISGVVNMSASKITAKTLTLPEGVTGTISVRYWNLDTDTQIGTTKTAGPGNVLNVASASCIDGTNVRIEYTLTTTTNGYSDVTNWTEIFNGVMNSSAGNVLVVPADPE